MATWAGLLTKDMGAHGESLADIVSNTMDDDEMEKEFNGGHGGTEGVPFTVWTQNRVYFPVCYDGAEWVGSVSRNPDGKPTGHHGGG